MIDDCIFLTSPWTRVLDGFMLSSGFVAMIRVPRYPTDFSISQGLKILVFTSHFP
jgi:hypothetical protein